MKNKQKIKSNYTIRFLRQYLIAYNIFENVISSSIKMMNLQSEHFICERVVDTGDQGDVIDVD